MLGLAGFFVLGYVLLSNHGHGGLLPDLVKPAPHHPPQPHPAPNPSEGLKLGQWYRPKQNMTWSWISCEWMPVPEGHGLLMRGTPLLVVERFPHAARLRGAVTEVSVIVTDGPGTRHFAPIATGDLPDAGDLPPRAEQKELR